MAKLVSKTYGEALFELAVEEGREDAFLTEIVALREVLKENPDFNKLMNHPKILKEEFPKSFPAFYTLLSVRTDMVRSMRSSTILLMK